MMASAELIPITLDGPDDRSLRLAWDRGAAQSLALREAPGAVEPSWRVEGELEWRAIEGLRLVSAVFEDGRALALAALRPDGAQGHDRDATACHLEESGEPVELTDALLSTEYDADGLPRRLGVELWVETDSPPLRVAADREGDVEVAGDGVRRELARMSFRLDGAGGVGVYELLRAA
jgi:hypothetical protein